VHGAAVGLTEPSEADQAHAYTPPCDGVS
jgi:hypothetical protein